MNAPNLKLATKASLRPTTPGDSPIPRLFAVTLLPDKALAEEETSTMLIFGT